MGLDLHHLDILTRPSGRKCGEAVGRILEERGDEVDEEVGVTADGLGELLERRRGEDRFVGHVGLRLVVGDRHGGDGCRGFGVAFGEHVGRTLQRLRQPSWLDGLGDVVVHAGVEEPFPVALQRVGGHRDDPRLRGRGDVRADPAGGLHAVHLRHLHVHQHDVVGPLFEHREDFEPVAGDIGRVAEPTQQADGNLLVHLVVLGKENSQRRAFRLHRFHGVGTDEFALCGHFHHRVEQHRRRARGRHVGSDGEFADRTRCPALGREQHEIEIGAGEFLNRCTVGCGLRCLGEDHVETAGPRLRDELVDVLDDVDCWAPLPKLSDERLADLAPRLVHESSQTGQRLMRLIEELLLHFGNGTASRDREAERRPFAGCALGPRRSAEHLRQPAADGQTEPGSAELPGVRAIHLGERLEEDAQLFGRHPHAGVLDRKPNSDGVRRVENRFVVDSHQHAAGLGELHRIRKEVVEDLTNPGAVRLHAPRQVGVHIDLHRKALGPGRRGNDLERLLDVATNVDVVQFDVELSRLDLREVENVVDDPEQRVATQPDRVDVLALLDGERRLLQQARHPDHAVHRRAELMAHVGHELALGRAGLVRLRARHQQVQLALSECLERVVHPLNRRAEHEAPDEEQGDEEDDHTPERHVAQRL